MQIVAKDFRVRGKRGASVRFLETRHFFFLALWRNMIKGFLIGGSNLRVGFDLINVSFYPTFLRIPHENEIIWSGIPASPLNPSGSATVAI